MNHSKNDALQYVSLSICFQIQNIQYRNIKNEYYKFLTIIVSKGGGQSLVTSRKGGGGLRFCDSLWRRGEGGVKIHRKTRDVVFERSPGPSPTSENSASDTPPRSAAIMMTFSCWVSGSRYTDTWTGWLWWTTYESPSTTGGSSSLSNLMRLLIFSPVLLLA